MHKTFSLIKPLVDRIPGGKKLAWNMYNFMTPNPERWISAHGIPLLANIHDKGLGTHLFLRGDYATARVSEIRQVVKEGDVVVDIGANIGYFTVLLADIVGPKGKVYAFEPDPRSFNILQRTIKRNGWSNVIAEQKAVSNKEGEILLYQTQSWTANAITSTEHVSTVSVQMVTLDDFLSNENHIDFVKMDMDGSEPFAIQGMRQVIKRSPNLKVLSEYQPHNLNQYLSKPLDFITIAEQCDLVLEGILDSNSGRLPDRDLAHLKHLDDNKNLDLLFSHINLKGGWKKNE